MTRKNKILIPQMNLGKIPSSYISNIKSVSYIELENFVNNNIKYGPQIVSIPVPPFRHAFFIDVQSDKIMISDWKKISKKNYNDGWEQYFDIMILLKKKYHQNIIYYPIDKKLYQIAKIHNDNNGGGGCSYYIFSWIQTRKEYINYQI